MTPSPESVRQMAPGQVPHWPPPWRDAHLPFLLLTPLMGLPSWAWGRLRGLDPLKSWPVEPPGDPHTTEALKTTAATAEKDGEVFGGSGLDPRASSPCPEVPGLSDEREPCGGATASVQPVLLGPGPQQRALCDPSEEKGCKEGKVVMEKAASTFSPPSHWPAKAQEGAGKAIRTGADQQPRVAVAWSPLPGSWQPQSAWTAAGAGDQESQKAQVGQLGADKQEEEKEAKEDSRAAEKGEVQGPFSILPSPFLRPWVYPPEDSTKKSASGTEGEKAEAEDPFSIPPTPFLRPWVHQPGEDTENGEEEEEEEEEDGCWGAAEGAAQAPASLPGASQNVCTFFRGEDTDEEEEEEEESDIGEHEDPSSLPGAPLTTPMACPGKDWGEDDDGKKDEAEKREDGESGVTEGCSSLPSTFLRNWIYLPGEEEEEEEEEEEAADSRPGASQAAWGPTIDQPVEPRPFQVSFYLPGEKPPPPWAPPQPPLWLWLRLHCTKPCATPPEPVVPVKERKVRFSEKVTVHLLAVWAGPARAARRGPWEQMARDRSRFARRIAQAQRDLGPCLTAVARARARVRLRKLAASHPTPNATTSSDPLPATPLSLAVTSPCPPPMPDSPSLDLNERRG